MSFFLTFEGVEGCGKTTQIGHLTPYLQRTRRAFLLTREPGGTGLGERIRQILLSSENGGIDPMAELLLYTAARVQHYRQVILPALRDGNLVVCDRFFDATLAYQGFGRRLDVSWIEELHARSVENVKPNLTFLIDLPVEEGLRRAWKRIESRRVKEDRFEKEDLEFHSRVRQGYLTLARREPGRIVILDGMKTESALFSEIVSILESKLGG